MTVYLTNTFAGPIMPVPISLDQARAEIAGGFTSAVGHADTAALYARLLGLPVAVNRVAVSLGDGDRVIGPRLPEGATALPEGARIDWWRIKAVP